MKQTKETKRRSRAPVVLLIAVALACSGCVSFSGPRDLERSLESAGNVTLHEEEGVCVGALVIGAANFLAGPWLPVSLDGVSTVDYGEYRIETPSDDSERLCLRTLELPGWEPFVRVREANSQMALMVEEKGASIGGMLFLEQTGEKIVVVRARGDFDKVFDNFMSSSLFDEVGTDMMLMGLVDDG